MHVLIIIAFIASGGVGGTGAGTSVQAVEFRSKAGCEAAQAALNDTEGNVTPLSQYRIIAFCQPK
jgi:hypothetical protein